MSRTISAGKFPKIKIDAIDGDLSIVGWAAEEILIKADEEGLSLQQNGDEVAFSCTDDVSLRIPRDASLFISRVGGDAALKGVAGNVEIKEVDNDLSIRGAGSVAIDTVQADFSLRGAKGNLYIKNAGGDVSIRDVEGNVSLDSVADDLALRGARGDVKVNVGEDVVVYLEPKAGGEYSISAGDDIRVTNDAEAGNSAEDFGNFAGMNFDWSGFGDRI